MRKNIFSLELVVPVLSVLALLILAACNSASSTTMSSTTSTTQTSTTTSTTSTGVTTTLTTTSTTPVSTPQSVSISLVAKSFAFDQKSITVPAGAEVTMEFDNQDSGIPHNFALYTDSTAAKSIYVGQLINGPAKTTYKFTAPSTAGSYFFRCDAHPANMKGTFIVQ